MRKHKKHAHYSEEFRNSVRDAWCLGDRPSVDSIAAEFGLHQSLIWDWIKKYGWREYREQVRAKADELRATSIAQERAKLDRVYLSLWTKFLTAAKDMIGIVIADRDAKGLAALSTVVRRAQDGHRIVLGIPEQQPEMAADERLAELSEEELEKEIDRLRDEILAGADGREAAGAATRKVAAAGGE